ncbi:MAG TPA: hypothetical protein VHV51_22530, partial [Polyangiaceae bacterium]|nr:hypothetical protein [Polyangiaceae bacterium]
MADPRTPIAGRYVFAGLLKNTQPTERWVATDESGRRVVVAVADAGRLTTLDSAHGVKHRHLAGLIEVVRDVDAASVPAGKALPPGHGVAIAEFVPGKTLHSDLAKAGMNPSKAVAWILRLADAVQALHTAGAVHATLSPRSVVAVPEGRAIAPVLSQLVAPPVGPYCPPERLKGSAETAPDDVWALHATLYTALTRQTPYRAPTRDALLKQMLSGKPKPLSAFGLDEPALQEILDRGLAYEKRVRVTELAEFIQTLDGWERDPRSMPAKRQIPPRPAPRSLMDIVGGSLGKDRDDGVVIDDASLPDDEGSELNPKPAAPPPAPTPPVPAVTPAPVPMPTAAPPPAPSASKASSSPVAAPLPPTREPLGSAPQLASDPALLAGGVAAPVQKRISINPFERKRAVWPLVLVAAIAGGGGVYLATAPDSDPPKPKPEEAPAPALTQKAPQPERKKLSPGQERDSCVASYFDPGAFDPGQNFAFVCADGDFRDISAHLQQMARPTPPEAVEGGAPAPVEPAHVDGGSYNSGLDWY